MSDGLHLNKQTEQSSVISTHLCSVTLVKKMALQTDTCQYLMLSVSLSYTCNSKPRAALGLEDAKQNHCFKGSFSK